VKFRKKNGDDSSERAQIYGSMQVELAWTVIPVLIVVALFLAAERVIASVQNAVLVRMSLSSTEHSHS
jgi:cytochrome c oxidase subunit 2